MSNVEILLVVWQDEISRSYYHIGTLSYYNGVYKFSYTSMDGKKGLGEAFRSGYMIHPAFPDTTKAYYSETLFSAFDRRIPSSDRKDYREILTDLGLGKYASKMDILSATRGRLASDTYSFEQPLSLDDKNNLRSSFFIHGMRHQELPDDWSTWVREKSTFDLVQEPDNEFDSFAIAVYAKNGKRIGYIPTFYSNDISSLIKNGLLPTIRVVYVNEKSHPHWWIQVEFECEIPAQQESATKELLAVV